VAVNKRVNRGMPASQADPGAKGGVQDTGHKIGYARVSMSDQNNQRQIDELVRFGVSPDDIYTDRASGRNMKRPGWQACWKDLREGDLLVVHSIDRLGRDLVEVISTVNALHAKGADLKVITMDLDTRSPTGRLIFSIMAAMAQWERELIVERTNHGLQAARARGIVGGKRPEFTDEQVLEAYHLYGMAGGARHLTYKPKRGKERSMSLSGFRKAVERAQANKAKEKRQ